MCICIPYSGLLLQGPNICGIYECRLDSQNFLLLATDLMFFSIVLLVFLEVFFNALKTSLKIMSFNYFELF